MQSKTVKFCSKSLTDWSKKTKPIQQKSLLKQLLKCYSKSLSASLTEKRFFTLKTRSSKSDAWSVNLELTLLLMIKKSTCRTFHMILDTKGFIVKILNIKSSYMKQFATWNAAVVLFLTSSFTNREFNMWKSCIQNILKNQKCLIFDQVNLTKIC